MKGAMSNIDSLFLHRLNHHIFEKACYHHNSGGEPSDIPLLKYDNLKKFHEDHYHPSNSMIMTYGDLDFTNHCEYIDRNVLTHFEQKDLNFTVELEPRLSTPKYKTEYFMPELISDPESQGKVGISYL
jgi:Zn-dependent M16 (insulinase) family peptidase